MRARKRTGRRSGFTLVEMLVVVAIIAVLVSLTAVAAFRLIGTQQSANTKSELSKVQLILQKQYRAAVDKFAKQETVPANSAAIAMSGGNNSQLAQVIWVKLRLKQTFPQTFNEALAPTPMSPLPSYQTYLTGLGYTPANTSTPQPWESSACLLMALQRGEEGGGVKIEDLGVSSFIHNYPTPNGGTIPALVDGWGKPLLFARWPVNSTVLNPPNGQPLPKDNNDPADPSGLLESTAWQQTAGYRQFITICHPVPQHAANTEATSYRIYPLVASSGPDAKFGFDQTAQYPQNPFLFAVTNANQAADNLYPNLFPDK